MASLELSVLESPPLETDASTSGKPAVPDLPDAIDAQVSWRSVVWRGAAVVWTFIAIVWLIVLDRLWLRRLYCRLRSRPYERLSWPIEIRLAFERLGPTYIKFGQMIASSEGLFPAALSLEFRKCLDRVPPFSSERARHILTDELGSDPDATFATFEADPVAAASIAQVHMAELQDGTPVAVKIQRPHLRRQVAADVSIMRLIARFLERLSRRVRLANLSGIVDDFARTIAQEIDFRLEGHNMDAFNAIFEADSDRRVFAPRVYWALTTRRVLTMERFHGWRVDDPEALPHIDDPENDLVTGVVAWFRCILEAGFFHGDVHAGNLMFLENGRLGFLDFGIIGRFNESRRMQAGRWMMCLAMRDFRQLADVMIEMDSVEDPDGLDFDVLTGDLERAYGPLIGSSIGDLNYQDVIPNLMRASVKHGLRFPQDFMLITKQIVYFDRYARQLAPGLNFFTDPRIVGLLASKLPLLGGLGGGTLASLGVASPS